MLPLVQRLSAVTKSATAASESRPNTRAHFESCGLDDLAAADFWLALDLVAARIWIESKRAEIPAEELETLLTSPRD